MSLSRLALSTAAAALFLVACGGSSPAPRPIFVPQAPPPAEPAVPGGGLQGPSCTVDADCPAGEVCIEHLVAACPVCDGGSMVKSCEPAPQAQPAPDCPEYVNCMPSPDDPSGSPCPSPELLKRCPGIVVAY